MKITLPIIPTPQARPRFCNRPGTGFAKAYKGGAQQQAEWSIEGLLFQHRPASPLEGPLALGVKAYLPIPRSWSKKKKAEAQSGILCHTSKPDLDNLIKQIKDCLTRMNFWRDDRQVMQYLPGTGKYYDDGHGPRWEIEIRPGSDIEESLK